MTRGDPDRHLHEATAYERASHAVRTRLRELCVLRLLQRRREGCGMPEKLAHRELRNRSAEVLREVAAGATYEITNHGDVVAVLSPPAPGTGTGLRIRQPRTRGGFAQLPRVRRNRPVQEVLDDLRGDQ